MKEKKLNMILIYNKSKKMIKEYLNKLMKEDYLRMIF